MKFIIFLFLLSVLENKCDEISGESYDVLQGPREAQVELFPYEALIGPTFCAGVLISEQYVLTPAMCVTNYSGDSGVSYSDVTVYLGFQDYLLYPSSRTENKTQIYKSSQVMVHENYDSTGYINNIALVKLSKTAILNEKVSPAKLLSNKEMNPMENTFANVSGWTFDRPYNYMHFGTVQILSQDTCNLYFKSDLTENQELCVEYASSSTSLDVYGDALNLNDKIVGFLTDRLLLCQIDSSSCRKTHIFLNLIPYLGWISEKTNIPIGKLTGQTELEDSSKMLKKTDDQFELIQKSQIKLDQEKANCDEKMSLLEEFEKTKEKMLERITNVKEDEEIRINDLEKKIDNIQETVDSILQENNVTQKQLEQVLKFSEEINIKFKKILELLSREIGAQ